MAEQYRFFGSTAGDTRQYNQIEFAEVFSRIFKNGYFPEVGNELQVTSTDPAGMTVEVKSGQAWINGYWYKNDSNKVLTINAADATLNRIDRVVLRLDVVMNRVIEALIIQGTPASNPAAPALTRTSQIYEISLAQIYVAAGVTSISQSAITDERDDINVCGKAVPYYVPTNDDISNVAAANKIIRTNVQGKLPVSITGDANTVGGKSHSDFQSNTKTYGSTTMEIQLAAGATETRYISIGSGKKHGILTLNNSGTVFFGTNNLWTRVQGKFYSSQASTSIWAWTRNRVGFVTRRLANYTAYGEWGFIGIDELFIEGDNIKIVFRNTGTETYTSTFTFDWEVW